MKYLADFFVKKIGIFAAFSYSGANFFLAFILQSKISASDFGLYAFSLICIQLGISVSNALFAAPIVVSLVDSGRANQIVDSYFKANIVFVFLSIFFLACVLSALGMRSGLIEIVLIQAFALWFRWFFRAIELAEQNFFRASIADFSYGAVTFLFGLLFFITSDLDEFTAMLSMAIGSIFSLLIIGRQKIGIISFSKWGSIKSYAEPFKKNASWALVGVITTEIMANLHSYILTVFCGPATFAPVAIVSLFFRPLPIIMQVITQYERPVFARAFKEGDISSMDRSVRRINIGLSCMVIFNTLAVVFIMENFPSMIGGGIDKNTILPILLLLAFGQLIRGLRTASSAALQGAGYFRQLAFVTIKAAPLTIVGTAIAILFKWEIVSMVLLAVLLGEFFTKLLINNLYKKMRMDRL